MATIEQIKNQMHVNAISHQAPYDRLAIDLANDMQEVRGFGMPITSVVAKKMWTDYFEEWEKCWRIVTRIKTETEFSDLKKDPDFSGFDKILDPAVQTVSGVFGKEIILQILAQRNCEGLRYVLGLGPDGKNTVVLFGVTQAVDENGNDVIREGSGHAVSRALTAKGEATLGNDPINGEVHLHSLTIREAQEIKPLEGIADVIFGEF